MLEKVSQLIFEVQQLLHHKILPCQNFDKYKQIASINRCVTREGKEISPTLFENWKKILKSFLAKKPEIFSLRGLYFSCFR